jgi:hypothetical protein
LLRSPDYFPRARKIVCKQTFGKLLRPEDRVINPLKIPTEVVQMGRVLLHLLLHANDILSQLRSEQFVDIMLALMICGGFGSSVMFSSPFKVGCYRHYFTERSPDALSYGRASIATFVN